MDKTMQSLYEANGERKYLNKASYFNPSSGRFLHLSRNNLN